MLRKTKISIQGMSCQHCVKTVTEALAGLYGVKSAKVNLRKNEAVVNFDGSNVTLDELKKSIIAVGFETSKNTKINLLNFLTASIASLILLSGVIGCSDVPYTGPILTVDNVDSYLDSIGGDVVCLQDGFDTVCLKLAELNADDTKDPAILEIYPENITYLFYYDNEPVLEAERAMDTTNLVQELIDSGRLDMPPGSTAKPSGNIAKITEGWTIQIHYPDSFPEADRGTTHETSGFTIKVADGLKINSINKDDELDIKYFLQREKADGSRVAQFSIETTSTKITIEVDGLVSEHIVKFYIDVDGVASDEGTNTFQLQPK